MIVSILVLFIVNLSWAQPPPPPPRLSNSFSSKIRQLNAGAEVQGEIFINYELKKELQIIDLGSNTTGVGKVHILDVGSTKKEYQYLEPFDFCIIPPIEVTLKPVWSWLTNATLRGTEKFQGKEVNVWILKNKHGQVVTEAGFLALDDDTPVFLVSSETGGPMIFDDYKNSAPPESKFAIPETCTKSDSISTHSPVDTVKFFSKSL